MRRPLRSPAHRSAAALLLATSCLTVPVQVARVVFAVVSNADGTPLAATQ